MFRSKYAAAAVLWAAVPAAAATWNIETVDTTGIGKFSSMKADKNGNLHLAYIIDDGNRFPLRYAIRDSRLKRWFTMTVAEGASFCSLVLDSQQRPHISYATPGGLSGSKLKYAYWTGNAWRQQIIPLNSDIVGYFTSIALDQEDKPRITFYEYRGPVGSDIRIRLRHVVWTGVLWEVRTLDPVEGSGKFNSMAADDKGNLHIVYANVSVITAGLRYAYWNGLTWTFQVIDGPESLIGQVVGHGANVVLDKSGTPHIAYLNISSPSLKYAVRTDNGWRVQTIDRLVAAAYPERNGIATGPDGRVFISYSDPGRGILKLARQQSSGKWVVYVVDPGPSAGFTSSVEICGDTVWIAYADEAGMALKVASAPLSSLDEAETSAARHENSAANR